MADSKSDSIPILDRYAGRILFWSIAVSFALRVIGYWLTPPREQFKDKSVEELDGEMVVLGAVGVSIEVLAGILSFVGKVLALIGFIQRGRDRERRRQEERDRRPIAE